MKEENLRKAVEAFLSPERTKSLRKIAKEYGVSPTTVHDRANGTKPRAEAHENNQTLLKYQEQLLEGYLIFLAQKGAPLSRMATRQLAGKLRSNWDPEAIPGPLSNSWLLGFLKRCKYLKLNKENHLDMPRVRENAGGLISQFFKLYTDYINIYSILPDDIWNLDEAGFKIGDSTKDIQYLVLNNRPTTVSYDTSGPVTVLEMISRAGKVGKPFFIYKGIHQMENWFFDVITESSDCPTSPSGFINEHIFNEWVSDHFPASEDKWTLLLMDGHLSHTSDRVIATLISKKIIPLYFPSHMINILQHLDRSCFGHTKTLYRRQISHNFCAGLSPTKARFFETYMNIREEAYGPKIIIEGWRRCGLLENNPDVALSEYRRQMHHDFVTPEDPVYEESVIEPEVGNISTPAPQKKLRKRKGGLENTGDLSFFKTNDALIEKVRKLELEVKRLQKALDEALSSKNTVSMELEHCEKKLAEEIRSHSRKRLRIPNPNGKVV